MRRAYILLIMCNLVLCCWSQTQQGYVKTLGRPNQKGVALSGVTVRVKGEHNPVLSKSDGTFSMHIQGESYSLQQVQKTGYELNEVGVIGREYAYSNIVPLTIVMVSKSQLQADKQRIEDKAYQTAEKNYKQQIELLEKQRAANAIAEEQYRQQIQDLQDKFEKYQGLIDGLADHYAHIDYDDLDEKEREINLCIENGELERADQLLQQLGIQQRIADIEKRLALGQSLMDEANADMAAVLKQQEKDAEHLYQLYTIALSRFDRDKAKFYIETRAALDTTNVQWQNDAGKYNHEYLADYNKALFYYQIVLHQSITQYGEQSEWVAKSYNNIGGVYSKEDNNDKALKFYTLALPIMQKIWGDEHVNIAISYNNIGSTYHKLNNYAKAQEYYSRSQHIMENVLEVNTLELALLYNNIGAIFSNQGESTRALEYYGKALNIYESFFAFEHPSVGTLYSNIGRVYDNEGQYAKAIEFYNKSIDIFKKILGTGNPSLALSYHAIGLTFLHQGNNIKALDYFLNSLAIYESFYGLNHSSVAILCNDIGGVYSDLCNYDKARDYYEKSLAISLAVFGKEHVNVASIYGCLSFIYYEQGDYSKAIDCYNKALTIFEKVYEPDHPDTQKYKEIWNSLKNNITEKEGN